MSEKSNVSLVNKQIAIYMPNLIIYGGGAEVYGLLLAEALEEKNNVIILTHEPHDDKFDINSVYDMYGVKHFKTIFLKYKKIKHLNGLQIWKDMDRLSSQTDIFVNCTIGIMRGMRNTLSIHIIHFPFPSLTGLIGRIYNRVYLKSYNAFICNSKYTQGYLKEYWGVEGRILYPPIAMEPVDDGIIERKEKIILAVGRIVADKKILEMINAFKKMYDDGSKDYRFVIIGNKDKNELDYLYNVETSLKNYPIELCTNIDKNELVKWYKKALLFWHAKGLNENENPYNAEHFGMTTVEAMANGCLPIVINKAGQKEIVQHGVFGYRWNTIDELIEYTIMAINDIDLTRRMQKKAVEASREYLFDSFRRNLESILIKIAQNGDEII